MSEENNPKLVKIGELLIDVGVLTSGDLTEAIQIAKRMGVPIGRVLVMSGCVTEQKLQYALELQSLIKDGLVDRDLGFKALHIVFQDQVDLQTALKKLNWEPKRETGSNKLGELLLDSNMVTPDQLERALESSFQSGMPLGGTLVLQGVLSAQLLPTVLHTQELIRDNKMGRDEAIEQLKTALMFWARADQSKSADLQGLPSAPAQNPASFVPPAAVQYMPPPTAAQSAPAAQPPQAPRTPESRPAPQAMPAPGAQRTQGPAGIPQQPAGTTGGAAKSPSQTHPHIEQPPPQEGPPVTDEVSLVELMKLAGFCTQNTLDHAVRQALLDPRVASKVLLAMGFIDSNTLNMFVYCQALIAKGRLRTDQALYALNAVRHRKVPLETVLQEIGIPAL